MLLSIALGVCAFFFFFNGPCVLVQIFEYSGHSACRAEFVIESLEKRDFISRSVQSTKKGLNYLKMFPDDSSLPSCLGSLKCSSINRIINEIALTEKSKFFW